MGSIRTVPDLPTLKVLRVASTISHVVAISTTVYRVFYRLHISPFSWDDGLAFAATIMDIIALVSVWLIAHVNDHRNDTSREAFVHNRIVFYWLLNVTATFVIWLSRMSLTVNFYRLLPKGRAKLISIILTLWFMVCWVPTSAWKFSVCTRDTSWAAASRGVCYPGQAEDLLEVIIDAIACASLLALAGYVLWQMNIPFKERKLIIFLFTGAIFTAIACSIHALFTLSASRAFQSFTTQIESAITLAASNIIVILASIYNLISRNPISFDNQDLDIDNHSNRTSTSIRRLFRHKERAKTEWVFRNSIKPAPFVDPVDQFGFELHNLAEPHARNTTGRVPTLPFTDTEVSVSSLARGPGNLSNSDPDFCIINTQNSRTCSPSLRTSSSFSFDSTSRCKNDDTSNNCHTNHSNHVHSIPSHNHEPAAHKNGRHGERGTPEEFSYYTESEQCSGSSIVILDPTDQSDCEGGNEFGTDAYQSRSVSQDSGTSARSRTPNSSPSFASSFQDTPHPNSNPTQSSQSQSMSLPSYPPPARLPPS